MVQRNHPRGSKRVIVKINDRTVVDYTGPESIEKERGRALKRISSDRFALQGMIRRVRRILRV